VVICALLIASLPTLAGCGPNSHWHVEPSDSPGSGGSSLTRLAVVSGNDIWAVGSYIPSPGSPSKTLTEHYDGTSWKYVPSPNLGSGDNVLNDVAAVSTNDVWAVGYYVPTNSNPPPPNQTLIEHWTGTATGWTPVQSPNGPSGGSILIGVEKVTANDIWAVGYYGPTSSSSSQTLIEHWTGTATGWTPVQSPSPGSVDNQLYGISAVDANDIWAVGYSTSSTGNANQTLIEHWTGTATGWTPVQSPNPGSGINQLNDVEAITADNVWAVGYSSGTSSPAPQTLTEHWTGTATGWTPVQSDNQPSAVNQLWGIAAVAATDIYAVGSYTPTASLTSQTLIEHSSGGTWTIGSNANQGSSDNQLNVVAAVKVTDIWAVGWDNDASGISQTLAMQFP
jgi:hypothetical protein